MSRLWATRGRNWGFRFLQDGGNEHVLEAYEIAFAGIDGSPTAFQIKEDSVAVRFPDPLGRKDRSGRVIPHEFVLTGCDAENLGSVEDVVEAIWPQVAERYADLWDRP
ncbi:hypothetical protein ACTXI4_12405 [Glutamicibacter ardleyensis]|uniref:hypothetical protein n=1 Tax=Glutamicibacter ardleyensis TaxID=225894 RepID=UPI003FD63946